MRARDEHAVGREAERLRGLRRELTDPVTGADELRQLLRRDPGVGEQRLVVCPAADVRELVDAGVGKITGGNACHMIRNVAGHGEEHRGLLEKLRLVVLHPADLLRQKAETQMPAGLLIHILVGADLAQKRFAFFRRALVVPDDGGAQRPAVCIRGDEGAALQGKGDAGDVLCHVRIFADLPHRMDNGLPPVLRPLLAPADLRRQERIGLIGVADQLAVRAEQQRLCAGRADVDPE